ncbi:MAG TPA: hypothetical protein VN420_05280 [Candidatus Fimivivens sp.]|nr:hypothetical protein [Candidatus Fimivivens sp.]
MENIMTFIGGHWMIIAFLAPFFWSLVNIIDVYFVDGVYNDAVEGSVIYGIFQILPWPILLMFVNIGPIDIHAVGALGHVFGLDAVLFLSLFGGVMYAIGNFFYFQALFSVNDAPMMQILWSLSVVVVPFLSFVIFREQLPFLGYVGAVVTLLGTVILSMSSKLRNRMSPRYAFKVLGAVLLLSLSMIMESQAYGYLNASYAGKGFWIGFLSFEVGIFLFGFCLAVIFRRNPFPVILKYYKVFILGEGLYFLGTIASQKALDFAPSASYVAVIEAFVPIFIMMNSLIILVVSAKILKNRSANIGRIYREQVDGIWIKVLATAVMAVGVFLIS